jgi:hypothetical protein
MAANTVCSEIGASTAGPAAGTLPATCEDFRWAVMARDVMFQTLV